MPEYTRQIKGIDYTYLREKCRNVPAKPTTSLKGKTVLITGANTGVGFEAALMIATLGCDKLLLGVRTLSKGEAAKQRIIDTTEYVADSIHVLQVDMTMFDSVSRFALEVSKLTDGRLDVAILNAGITPGAYHSTPDGWEETIQVNTLSTALLAVKLRPLLRAAAHQPAVLEIVGSMSYTDITGKQLAAVLQRDEPFLDYCNRNERFFGHYQYALSKLAVECMRDGLMPTNGGCKGAPGPDEPVIVTCCPGMTHSDLQRSSPWFMWSLVSILQWMWGRETEVGARTLVNTTLEGPNANGRMAMNDTFDDLCPALTEEEYETIQRKVWPEIVAVLKRYDPNLDVEVTS